MRSEKIGAALLGACWMLFVTNMALAIPCTGDCDGDEVVRIDELVTGIDIALGGTAASACEALACPQLGGAVLTCLIAAVNNALSGCPGPAPDLALVLDVVPHPNESRVDVTATISNRGGSIVSYLSGCSGRCRPPYYEAITLDLIGPDGGTVLIDSRCPVLPCYRPPSFAGLPPGSSRSQTISVTGTQLAHQEQLPRNCFDGCAQVPLAPGRYRVVARFAYRIGHDWTDPQWPDVTATTEFDWPPTARPAD